jgi:hypothetical protein
MEITLDIDQFFVGNPCIDLVMYNHVNDGLTYFLYGDTGSSSLGPLGVSQSPVRMEVHYKVLAIIPNTLITIRLTKMIDY